MSDDYNAVYDETGGLIEAVAVATGRSQQLPMRNFLQIPGIETFTINGATGEERSIRSLSDDSLFDPDHPVARERPHN